MIVNEAWFALQEGVSTREEIDIGSFPTSPGVYLMRDPAGKVIYVGKAKNLRSRMKQYAQGHDDRAMVPPAGRPRRALGQRGRAVAD